MLENTGKSENSILHRKKFGQFFTPSIIARLMAGWVLGNSPENILDPAFGSGVFYNAVEKLCDQNNRPQFTACEIDPDILKEFKPEAATDNLTLINTDYLKYKTPVFDAIICNPPYGRFQNFQNRHSILPELKKQIGKELAGHINLSDLFL
jgi:adenine-specific DNA-methyltransferase